MSKNIKGAIPKWRFLEFKGNGDWERKKLGKMAFIVNDKIAIEKLNAETYISTENMLPNFAGVSTASQLPQTGNFTKFKAGDILVSNIRPYLKKVWRSNKTGGASNDVIVFRSNSDIDSNFLEFILKNELFINYVMKNAKGLKMPRGDKESMLIYPVYIPPYPTFSEQQKIADCLSSVDDLISAEEKKLALLNDYKKGWMQKLFPAEGKTVPEWRFPEFKDSKGWEKLNIEKACYPSYSGGTPVTSKKEYYNGDIPFIRSGEIGKKKTELFLTSEGLDNSSAKMIEKGDVLMALYGANSGDVAISPIKGAINQAILCLRHKNNNAFLYHYLAFKKNWIVRTYIQGGQGNLSGEIVKSIELCSPQEPDEQNRIAAFLSVIDELTSNQKEKIEALKQHKKALMQGLFPSIEEV